MSQWRLANIGGRPGSRSSQRATPRRWFHHPLYSATDRQDGEELATLDAAV